MISKQYQSMLSGKSVIRELSEYATARGHEIGYENVFDYSLGNPSVPVPSAYNDKLIELIQTGDPMLVHGYSPSLGIPAVREKIAASLNRRFGMNYKGEDIFMTSGAAGALAHAFRLVTAPGDEILTFAPFFPEYNPYVNLTGARLRVVPASFADFQINFDAFEQMLTENVHAVLVNTPNNPSGAVYSARTLTRLAELLTAKEKQFGHDIWLISDEPYRELVYGGVEVPFRQGHPLRLPVLSAHALVLFLLQVAVAAGRPHRLRRGESGQRRLQNAGDHVRADLPRHRPQLPHRADAASRRGLLRHDGGPVRL